MQTNIYIITEEDKAIKNEFKIGFHTGDKAKLLSRYNTYFTSDAELLLFEPATPNDEKNLLCSLNNVRKVRNGKETEWVKVPRDKLLYYVKNYLSQGRNENYKQYKKQKVEVVIDNLLELHEINIDTSYRKNQIVLENLIDLQFLLDIQMYNKNNLIEYYLLIVSQRNGEKRKKGYESEDDEESEDEIQSNIKVGEESEDENQSNIKVGEGSQPEPEAVHISSSGLRCNHCKEKFTSPIRLQIHIKNKICIKRVCTVCAKTFSSERDRLRHDESKIHQRLSAKNNDNEK